MYLLTKSGDAYLEVWWDGKRWNTNPRQAKEFTSRSEAEEHARMFVSTRFWTVFYEPGCIS